MFNTTMNGHVMKRRDQFLPVKPQLCYFWMSLAFYARLKITLTKAMLWYHWEGGWLVGCVTWCRGEMKWILWPYLPCEFWYLYQDLIKLETCCSVRHNNILWGVSYVNLCHDITHNPTPLEQSFQNFEMSFLFCCSFYNNILMKSRLHPPKHHHASQFCVRCRSESSRVQFQTAIKIPISIVI